MKSRNNIIKLLLTLSFIVCLFLSNCKKEENNNNIYIPILSTIEVSEITSTTAISGGNISSDCGSMITARGVCWSTSQYPTIENNKTIDGEGAGSYTSELTGLSAGVQYYVRAYASNVHGTGYGSIMSFSTINIPCGQTFIDSRDGTIYSTIQIGEQCWMAENLKFLPSVVGPGTSSSSLPYYYVYGYSGTNVTEAKATLNYNTYGVLYNWTAAMDSSDSSGTNPSGVQGVCPPGWHMPSQSEWNELINYLGGETLAGGKLKESNNNHWQSPNTGATNISNFTALPGGRRYESNIFDYVNILGYWWTSGRYQYTDEAYYIKMGYNNSVVNNGHIKKENGLSIRCVRD